jgi:hypothetical protein
MYLRVQQSRKRYKKHILTLLKNGSEQDQRQRIRRREFALKQFRKRKFLLERKKNQSKLIGTITFRSVRYKNDIPQRTYNDNIFLNNPSQYVAELLDGLPQSVNDTISYQVIGNNHETDYARSKRQLVGLSNDELDLESSYDIALLDKALASLQDEITKLGGEDTSSELVSISKRIQNLEQDHDHDHNSKSNTPSSTRVRSPMNKYSNKRQSKCSQLGYNLLNSLLPYGLKPSKIDLEILVSATDTVVDSEFALSFAIQLAKHCNIWQSHLSVKDLELLFTRILKIFLDNAEVLHAKQLLILMRTMSIVPCGNVQELMKLNLYSGENNIKH